MFILCVRSEIRKRGWQEPGCVLNTAGLHGDAAGARGPSAALGGLL